MFRRYISVGNIRGLSSKSDDLDSGMVGPYRVGFGVGRIIRYRLSESVCCIRSIKMVNYIQMTPDHPFRQFLSPEFSLA